MNHEWATDVCGNCKIKRSKTTGGTTKYTMIDGKTRWTPGPCVAPGAKIEIAAPPKSVEQAFTAVESAAKRATTTRTEKPFLVSCSRCGTQARVGQDCSDWTKDNVCPDCQEPETAEARTIRIRLVPITRTDLMCVVCGMFRTELGIAHDAESDMQSGIHKKCVNAAHSKRGAS